MLLVAIIMWASGSISVTVNAISSNNNVSQ